MRKCLLILALLLAAASALAQPCTIGVFVDTAGTQSVFSPTSSVPFDVYVVMHVESTVAGVALTINWPPHIFPSLLSYGPSGLGLNVNGAGGMNIGLGECALGFNYAAIVVISYSAWPLPGPPALVQLGPNTDEDPSYPVYATCADQLLACDTVIDLELVDPAATESASIGTLKALYGN